MNRYSSFVLALAVTVFFAAHSTVVKAEDPALVKQPAAQTPPPPDAPPTTAAQAAASAPPSVEIPTPSAADPAAGVSAAAVASEEEDIKPPPKPRFKKKSKRRLASTESDNSYSELRVRNGRRDKQSDIDARIGGLAGFTAMSASYVDPSYTNIGLELMADIRAWKYIGVDLDIHGDLLTGKFSDGTAATSPKLSRQLRGGLLNLKGQYPFWVQKVKFVPKLGVGYGINSIDDTSTSSTGTESGSITTITGVYAIFGFDIEPTPKLVFFLDYLHSLATSGSVASGGTGASVDLVDPGFDRFRVGGYYRFAPQWGIGGQVLRRSTGYTGNSPNAPAGTATAAAAANGGTTDASQFQIMGLLMLELQ